MRWAPRVCEIENCVSCLLGNIDGIHQNDVISLNIGYLGKDPNLAFVLEQFCPGVARDPQVMDRPNRGRPIKVTIGLIRCGISPFEEAYKSYKASTRLATETGVDRDAQDSR